jgi:hypothetical protein
MTSNLNLAHFGYLRILYKYVSAKRILTFWHFCDAIKYPVIFKYNVTFNLIRQDRRATQFTESGS